MYDDLDAEEERLRAYDPATKSPALSPVETMFHALYFNDKSSRLPRLVGPLGERPVLVCLLHAATMPGADSEGAQQAIYDAVRCSTSKRTKYELKKKIYKKFDFHL